MVRFAVAPQNTPAYCIRLAQSSAAAGRLFAGPPYGAASSAAASLGRGGKGFCRRHVPGTTAGKAIGFLNTEAR